MKGTKKLTCLLCDRKKQEKVKVSLRHVHEHFSYKKYACTSCDQSFYSEDDALLHQLEMNHSITTKSNEYLELIAANIYMDCLLANKSGIKHVIRKYKTSFNVGHSIYQDSGDIVEVNPESILMHEENHNNENFFPNQESCINECTLLQSINAKNIVIENPENYKGKEHSINESIGNGNFLERGESSSHDAHSGAYLKADRKSSHKKQKQLFGEKGTGDIITEDISDDSDSESIVADTTLADVLTTKNRKQSANCAKCGEKVSSLYVQRRKHVLEQHLIDYDNSHQLEILSSEIRSCFPGFRVYCDLQCIECGKMYRSESGRRLHVLTDHYQQTFNCVVPRCNFFDIDPRLIKIHIQKDHCIYVSCEESTSTSRAFFCAKKKFEACLAPQIMLYFPMSLPQKSSISLPIKSSENVSSVLPKENVTVSWQEETDPSKSTDEHDTTLNSHLLNKKTKRNKQSPFTPMPQAGQISSANFSIENDAVVPFPATAEVSTTCTSLSTLDEKSQTSTPVTFRFDILPEKIIGDSVSHHYLPRKRRTLIPDPVSWSNSTLCPERSEFCNMSYSKLSSDPNTAGFAYSCNLLNNFSSRHLNRSESLNKSTEMSGHGSDCTQYASHNLTARRLKNLQRNSIAQQTAKNSIGQPTKKKKKLAHQQNYKNKQLKKSLKTKSKRNSHASMKCGYREQTKRFDSVILESSPAARNSDTTALCSGSVLVHNKTIKLE